MSDKPARGATLRAGIVGARRVRQGLGPFVARDLAACGVKVDLVLGTTEDTARAAAEQVAQQVPTVRPRWTTDPDEFDAADLQVACILSPAGTHLAHVERALAADRHVLCEKPFAWTPEAQWSDAAADLEARFQAAGRVLAVNTQWPWTLDAHSAATGPRGETARSLVMGLAPASGGAQMIGDALPHPLSLAQALRPDLRRIVGLEVSTPSPGRMEVEGVFEGARGAMKVRVILNSTQGPGPREAWYSVDGRRADRLIDAADYSLAFQSGDRHVPLPDPLTARISSFVEQVQAGEPCPWTRAGDIARRASILEAAAAAFETVRP